MLMMDLESEFFYMGRWKEWGLLKTEKTKGEPSSVVLSVQVASKSRGLICSSTWWVELVIMNLN